MCYTTQTYWCRYRNLISIPLKIVGIVSVSCRFEKAGISHPCRTPQLAEHWANDPKVIGSIPVVVRQIFPFAWCEYRLRVTPNIIFQIHAVNCLRNLQFLTV